MKNRHRLPAIFSIYMVDVLCCALGCVVLLWLINFREARDRALAAAEASKRLSRTQSALHESTSELDAKIALLAAAREREEGLSDRVRNLTDERDKWLAIADKTQLALNDTSAKLKYVDGQLKDTLAELTDRSDTLNKTQSALSESQKREKELHDQLAALQLDRNKLQQLATAVRKDYDETLAKLQSTLGQLAELKIDYKDLEDDATKTTAELEKTVKENTELAQQIAALNLFLSKTKKDLADKTAQNKTDAKELRALTDRLLKSSNFTKELEQQLASLQIDLKDYQDKLAEADTAALTTQKDYDALQKQLREMLVAKQLLDQKLQLNDKDIEAARKAIAGLKGENLALLRQTQQVQEAAKRRFAGITLEGQRIMFLIDMSGSMGLADENTLDPDKWPFLCDSVGQIMRSMSNLEKYQVILFSDQVRYPLGGQGQWFDYSAETSPQLVVDTLKRITPEGATNLYAGFSEAFRFRSSGLDTIYLFSDGLPTDGPGLPANVQLTERQRTDYYSRHLRNSLNNTWNRPITGLQKVRINTIGFFFDSPDLGSFLWTLARDNDGSFVGLK